MRKVAIVTGGSSGIGLYTAIELKKAGCTVYEFSRREPVPDNGITHISADISHEEAVKRAVGEVFTREGKIDILVNNAGFGISGAVEFTELTDAKKQMDVNFFGAVNVTKAVLPLMREAQNGRIVNISSVAGAIPIPFQTFYSATKAALIAYTRALIREVKPLGIGVCAILPGDIRTGFTGAREKAHVGDDVYNGRISRSVFRMERDEQKGMSPEKAGRAIARIALKKRVRPLYSIGFIYKLILFLVKILPAGFVSRVVGLLYAR